jgi:hypothetical protein
MVSVVAKREPTMEEIRHIAIQCANDETVVVGGMAVSILAELFQVSSDEPCMTKDADFLGGLMALETSAENLPAMSVRKYIADMVNDAGSPNTGKLAVEIADDADPVEIDFLFRIDGLSNEEIEQKAIRVTIDGKDVRVIHPILLLEAKVNNLGMYPAKRNEAGVNQARLSIAIAKKYLEQTIANAEKNGDSNEATTAAGLRQILNLVERIARVAERDPACLANKEFGLDILDAIPASAIASKEFTNTRWPQIREHVAGKRKNFDEIWKRMSKLSDPKNTRFRV